MRKAKENHLLSKNSLEDTAIQTKKSLMPVADPAIGVGGWASPPRSPTKNVPPPWTNNLNYT